ncbi:MAG: 16S rRNA (cytosine(967)-C(5))-methyltransferase RsmB [bacterium]|nr:16S rRNA (cytosine(967)-C(5))-methyltransferase RsmB [bacterium]
MTTTIKINERELVLDILLLVTRDGIHSHLAINQVLEKHQYLEKNRRSFISRLVHGTLERMIELDYILNRYSNTPVNKMKPVIRNILRSGVYQLLYMDSVPASAACNEAVRLAERKGFRALKGFVNGVLRSIARDVEAGKLAYPDESDEKLSLSVKSSVPLWLIEHWENSYGMDQTRKICEAFLIEAPTSIRVNTEKISVEELADKLEKTGVTVVRNPEVKQALFISGYDYLGGMESFLNGEFYVQDVSSMQAVLTADVQKDWNVIDVCAAPGGKSIHVAQLLEGSGHVLSRDLTEYKVDLIWDNIERNCVKNMEAQVWDATQLDESRIETADLVIADLPCSGLGVLRAKPDIKYNMKPDQMMELAMLQRKILSVVWQYVKPGGKLLFSTCTINRDENENNTEWFLKEYRQFERVYERQLFPNEYQDGFYIALLKRK